MLGSCHLQCALDTTLPDGRFVRVSLLNGGPGLNFDFVTLSFHVPLNGSLWGQYQTEAAKVKNDNSGKSWGSFHGYLLRKSSGYVFPVSRGRWLAETTPEL